MTEGNNNTQPHRESSMSPDPIVQRVCRVLEDRSRVGLQKYGVTLDGAELSELEWHWHHLHELLDAAGYVMKKIDGLEKQGVALTSHESVTGPTVIRNSSPEV